jgi:hypothetical protein
MMNHKTAFSRRVVGAFCARLLTMAALLGFWPVIGQEFGSSAHGSLTNFTYQIPTNTIIEFQVPLTPSAQIAVANSGNGILQVANAGIAVPAGFNPTNIYPLLIVNATSDSDGSSIRSMKGFTNVALKLGFVVMAADGPFGRPTNDSPAFRYAMLSSVMEHTHRSWPASKKWPVACAGFSGGAKWSGVIGASLSARGYHTMGVFMGGCNEDYASQAARNYHPAVRYKRTPMFLSSGNQDNIATPQHHEDVRRNLVMNGFNMVRLESHEGGHSLDQDHLEKALGWFLQVYRMQRGSGETAASGRGGAKTNEVKQGKETAPAEPTSETKPTELPK